MATTPFPYLGVKPDVLRDGRVSRMAVGTSANPIRISARISSKKRKHTKSPSRISYWVGYLVLFILYVSYRESTRNRVGDVHERSSSTRMVLRSSIRRKEEEMQLDSHWAGQIGSLIGAGGVGMIVLEIIKRAYARADKKSDDEAGARRELRENMLEDIKRLSDRVDKLEAEVEVSREREVKLTVTNAELSSENVRLRNRYHQLLDYLQILIPQLDLYAEQLGVPDEKRPKLPSWIHQNIDGPTSTGGGVRT